MCAETPLSCEHCGVTGLRRREMKQHEADECEEIPIKCEFSRIGCDHAKVMIEFFLSGNSSKNIITTMCVCSVVLVHISNKYLLHREPRLGVNSGQLPNPG